MQDSISDIYRRLHHYRMNAAMERRKKDHRDNLIEKMKRLVDIHTSLTSSEIQFDFKKSKWFFDKFILPGGRNYFSINGKRTNLNIPRKGYKKFQVGRGGIITFSNIPDSDAFKERLSRFIEAVVPLLSEDIKILEEKIAKAVADAETASAERKEADERVRRGIYGQ